MNYMFNTLDDAQTYADSKMMKLNENSFMDDEKEWLLPYMPPLELAQQIRLKSASRLRNVFPKIRKHIARFRLVLNRICLNNRKG